LGGAARLLGAAPPGGQGLVLARRSRGGGTGRVALAREIGARRQGISSSRSRVAAER